MNMHSHFDLLTGRCRWHHQARLGLVGILSLYVLVGCRPQEDAELDPVAIQVGERVIRLSELQAQVDYLATRNVPLAYDAEAFVEDSVERAVALQKARELGLEQDVELRRQMENLLIGRLKQRELDLALNSVHIGDDELQAYYEARLDRYARPAQHRLALLYLPADKLMSDDRRSGLVERLEEARELAEELPEGTRGFGELAQRYSEEATSRFKGGDIGWLSEDEKRSRWPAAVLEAGFALKVGELSKVLETESGAYLLMKLDAREAVVPPLEGRLASALRHELLQEKRVRVAAEVETRWAQEVALQTHPSALEQLNFQTPTKETSAVSSVTRHLP